MSASSLRRYDVQAKLSTLLSALATLGVVAMAYVIFRNFDRQLMVIPFRAGGLYLPIVLGLSAATMFLAAVGLLLGFNSAGQRRNERQGQSWLGFFLGTAMLSLSIVLFALFYLYKLPMTVQ